MTLKIYVKVRFKVTKMKPIHDILFMVNSYYMHILHDFLVISHKHMQYIIIWKIVNLNGKYR